MDNCQLNSPCARDPRADAEIEALSCIFNDDELVVTSCMHPSSNCSACYDKHDVDYIVECHIKPLTAGNTTEQRVSFQLVANLPFGYPEKAANISIKRPRGISDNQLSSFQTRLQVHCQTAAKTGDVVLYDLIELCQAFLTESNWPSAQCPLCLLNIERGEMMFVSSCSHYFHSYCLRRQLEYVQRHVKALSSLEEYQRDADLDEASQFLCAVCREPLALSQFKRHLGDQATHHNHDSGRTSKEALPDVEEPELLANFPQQMQVPENIKALLCRMQPRLEQQRHNGCTYESNKEVVLRISEASNANANTNVVLNA